MKLFIDSAKFSEINEAYSTGLIDGVTTNPSLILRSGQQPYDIYHQLYDLGVPDISMEVVGDAEEMIKEGKKLSNTFPGLSTIKVPCTPDGIEACRVLSLEHIKVNVTLVFSPAQAILAHKAGAYHVSPFVGRVDDNSYGGLCLIKDIANVYRTQRVIHDTNILAASIRGVRDVSRAFEYGADIVTIPAQVFHAMYRHVLTDSGMDRFNKDWALANNIIVG